MQTSQLDFRKMQHATRIGLTAKMIEQYFIVPHWGTIGPKKNTQEVRKWHFVSVVENCRSGDPEGQCSVSRSARAHQPTFSYHLVPCIRDSVQSTRAVDPLRGLERQWSRAQVDTPLFAFWDFLDPLMQTRFLGKYLCSNKWAYSFCLRTFRVFTFSSVNVSTVESVKIVFVTFAPMLQCLYNLPFWLFSFSISCSVCTCSFSLSSLKGLFTCSFCRPCSAMQTLQTHKVFSL